MKKNKYQYDSSAGGEEEIRVSRSQKKRDSTALQKLGEAIAALPAAKRSQLPLTPDLAEAYTEFDRIREKEGRRRQLQYIGRLMREADGEAIQAAFENLGSKHNADMRVFHHAEKLRDAMLAQDEAVCSEITARWPDAAGELLELAAQARQERASSRPPKSSRELFRRIHALLLAPAAGA